VRSHSEALRGLPVESEERIDLLLRHLGTRREGLSEREAARRLEQHGPNEIQRCKGPSRVRERRRRRLYHFDARVKRMTTADEEPTGELWYHTKGAPLELLERGTVVRGAQGDRPLTGEDREKVRVAFERYAGEGLRVLGFAERRIGTGQPTAFPLIVWGTDELRRWALRRREGGRGVPPGQRHIGQS
jgi:magnesium-transporting ATPase (P-type)